MINRFHHAATGATVQFSANPLRGSGEQASRFQSIAYDSAGAAYVYARNSTKRRQQSLVYPQQSAAVLADLLTFVQARNGDKTSFTWDDHDGTAHTAWFSSGHVGHKETSPGRYRIEVSISEDT